IEWTDPLGLNRDKNHSTDKKPNIANRRCDCRKWNIDNSDRVCEGHVSGVGRAKFYRNPETGEWWSADQTGHGGSAWKVFTEERGSLTWKADANEFGDFIEGKHKGPTGRSISLKDLKCLNQR
uniref:hypothetical protein n=1 Tax=Pseudomonas sp. RIT-PI-AD TaxID=3035294 RepID=UPI0021DB7B02